MSADFIVKDAEPTSTSARMSQLPPRIFLILENPKKSNNLGPILRCAAAFAVTQVILVGFEKCNTEGSHGASKHVDIVAFPVWDQAVTYLRAATLDDDENDDGSKSSGCNVRQLIGLLCCHGVDATDAAYSPNGCMLEHDVEHNTIRVGGTSPCTTSRGDNMRADMPVGNHTLSLTYPVHTRPFTRGGNIGILVSKSNKGLPMDVTTYCDTFVHVPHVAIAPAAGSQSTDLALDVPSCLSITLHHLTQWADYHERVFEGHKFQVAPVQRGRLPTFQSNKKGDRNIKKLENEVASEMALESACSMESRFNNETNGYDY